MPPLRRVLTVPVMLVAILFSPLDYSILEPALPAIQRQYAVNEQNLSWTYTLLAMAMMIGAPLLAKFSDVRGRRLAFMLTMTIFALGTLLCALAPSYGILLVGRVLQGLGAGGIAPIVTAVIADHSAPALRGTILSLIGVIVGIGLLAGPLIGDLTLKYGWQSLFFFFAPFIFLGGVLGYTLIPPPASNQAHPQGSFDMRGLVLLILTVAPLMVGLTSINPDKFFGSLVSVGVLPFLLAALVFLVVLILVELRMPDPLVAVSAFRSPQIALAASLALGYGFARTALAFLPGLATAALHEPVANTVALLLPLAGALIIGSLSAGALVDRVGTRPVVLTGLSALTLAILLFSQFATNPAVFLLAGILFGLGSAVLIGAPVRYMFLNEFRADHRGAGQGLFAILWALGQQLSGVLVGSLLAAQVPANCRGVAAASCDNPLPGYTSAYVVIGIVMLVLTIAALGLQDRNAEQAAQSHLA